MTAYSRNATLPLPLPCSPSLQPNNLSLRQDGNAFVYTRLNEVIYLSTIGKNDHHKIPAPAKTQVYQAAFIATKCSTFLVITASSGAYIWSEDGSSMHFFLALSDIVSGDIDFQFMRGIAGNSNSAFVGTSFGHVLEISIPNPSGDYGIEHTTTVSASSHPISCISTHDNYLICGDDNGSIKCFQTSPRLHDHPMFSKNGDEYPCTSLVSKNDMIIAGFSTGHLRLYRISTAELVLELTAHIRCVMGLALHPTENLVTSTSEDQYVCVWAFGDFASKASKSMDLVCTEKLDNRLCTGIAFLAEDRIGVTSYDEEDLAVLQRLP